MSLMVSNPAARTQPGKSPDSTTRQPSNPAAPGSLPGSTRKCAHVLTAWQNLAAPGSTWQHPGSTWQHPGTRQHPATRH